MVLPNLVHLWFQVKENYHKFIKVNKKYPLINYE